MYRNINRPNMYVHLNYRHYQLFLGCVSKMQVSLDYSCKIPLVGCDKIVPDPRWKGGVGEVPGTLQALHMDFSISVHGDKLLQIIRKIIRTNTEWADTEDRVFPGIFDSSLSRSCAIDQV